ncbi:MAG: homoserine dehydrogenase [Defluviitaleaceae bacterium]|nr:homoserine dehydrogenase [Defluviitaleaceae bacterium]
MVYIAILGGFGVIGSGVAQVLAQNAALIEKKAGQAVAVKRVLDIRDCPGHPMEHLLTKNFEDILTDDEIKIVAEVMGGTEPAYTYAKRALLAGKSVCTSNKELVIKHGAELLRIAQERELNFMFEASVGGGIPIVRPMNLALTTDEIVAVAGILNGTSNYILHQMEKTGAAFADALAGASALGYAEKNPKEDVEGRDASRKLAILLSLATGRQVNYEEIHTEGITGITAADFSAARHFGYTIKLLVDGRINGGGLEAMVAPALVHGSNAFSTVGDVFNCVLVQAKVTDNVMFYGRGAGKLPTAGAVISDIVDVSKHLHRHIMHTWSEEVNPVLPAGSYIKKKMVRAVCSDTVIAKNSIEKIYPGAKIFFSQDKTAAWFTPPETEDETSAKTAALAEAGGILKIEKTLRVYEPVNMEKI